MISASEIGKIPVKVLRSSIIGLLKPMEKRDSTVYGKKEERTFNNRNRGSSRMSTGFVKLWI